MITIEKINHIINNSAMKTEDFSKNILVTESKLLTEDEYNKFYESQAFSQFLNGNIRKNNGKYTYAIAKIVKKLKEKNKVGTGNVIYHKFHSAFKNILKDKKNIYSEIAQELRDLSTRENLYYEELNDEVGEFSFTEKELPGILSLFLIIAIFQDDIRSLYPQYKEHIFEGDFFPLSHKIKNSTKDNKDSVSVSDFLSDENKTYGKYLNIINNNIENITTVQLSTYIGSTWLNGNDEKYKLLRNLASKKIKIKILINSPENYDILVKLMRDEIAIKLGSYSKAESVIDNWKVFSNVYPNITVKKSKRPILQSFLNLGDGNNLPLCTGLYQYKNHDSSYLFIDRNADYGQKLINDFSYLWENESDNI